MSVLSVTHKIIQRLEGLGHSTDDVSWSASSSEPEESEHGGDINWEIPRKVLHSSIGFFTLYFYVSESPARYVIRGLWSSLCIIYPADLLRFRYPSFARLYERLLGFLMRNSEKNSTNGVIWYILGVNVALQFYPPDVATLSILILSWADTAASTIGRLYGPSSPRLPPCLYIPHHRFPLIKIPLSPRKSVAGFLAASLTGLIAAVGFWGWIAPVRLGGTELSWDFVRGVTVSGGAREAAALRGWIGLSVIGIVSGLVSGITEALDLGSLDDNLTLPIISGGCILGFLKVVQWFSASGSSWTY